MNRDVPIDIETIPCQREGYLELLIEQARENVRVPSKMTKTQMVKDLCLSPDDARASAEVIREMWLDRKGGEHAEKAATEKWLKTSFDGGLGEIACISWAVEDSTIINVSRQPHECEAEMLRAFDDQLCSAIGGREHSHPYFIVHNAAFDLPFLWKRMVIRGVKPRFNLRPYGRHGSDHYCTMTAWAGFKGTIALDLLADYLGLQGKLAGMSGDQVWPEIQAGNLERVVKYCDQDVRALRSIYQRLTFKNAA